MSHDCQKEEVIEIIREDLKEIKGDIKELLKFRAMLLGVTTFVSIIAGLVINYISRTIKL